MDIYELTGALTWEQRRMLDKILGYTVLAIATILYLKALVTFPVHFVVLYSAVFAWMAWLAVKAEAWQVFVVASGIIVFMWSAVWLFS